MLKPLLLVGLVMLIISAVLASASQTAAEQSKLLYRVDDFAAKQTFNFDWTFEKGVEYQFELTGEIYNAGLSGALYPYMVVNFPVFGHLSMDVQRDYRWVFGPLTQTLTGNVVLLDYHFRELSTDTVESQDLATLGIDIYQIEATQPYWYLLYVGISVAIVGCATLATGVLYPRLSSLRSRSGNPLIRLEKEPNFYVHTHKSRMAPHCEICYLL